MQRISSKYNRQHPIILFDLHREESSQCSGSHYTHDGCTARSSGTSGTRSRRSSSRGGRRGGGNNTTTSTSDSRSTRIVNGRGSVVGSEVFSHCLKFLHTSFIRAGSSSVERLTCIRAFSGVFCKRLATSNLLLQSLALNCCEKAFTRCREPRNGRNRRRGGSGARGHGGDGHHNWCFSWCTGIVISVIDIGKGWLRVVRAGLIDGSGRCGGWGCRSGSRGGTDTTAVEKDVETQGFEQFATAVAEFLVEVCASGGARSFGGLNCFGASVAGSRNLCGVAFLTSTDECAEIEICKLRPRKQSVTFSRIMKSF
jgi:hypothetical protein